MSIHSEIAPPRIGTGVGWFIAGGLLLAFGLFAFLAGAGGAQSAVLTASFCLPVAALLIAIGFWVRLFGLVELRLIDLEGALKPSQPEASAPEPSVAIIPADVIAGVDEMSEAELRSVIETYRLDPNRLTTLWGRSDIIQFIKARGERA